MFAPSGDPVYDGPHNACAPRGWKPDALRWAVVFRRGQVAQGEGRPETISSIAESTQMSKSTAKRILRAHRERGGVWSPRHGTRGRCPLIIQA